MQFTTFALSALSIGSALAAKSSNSSAAGTTSTSTSGAVKVHVVKVGNANGTLAYSPNSLTAAVGDMVQFQFAPANHSVTQSTFDQPCMPIAMNANTTGIFSGFMPVAATAATTPTYTIMINNTTPMWLYCSQAKHCQNGMTMVINVNPTANASRTLANYQALAKLATVNLPGNAVSGGASSGSSSGTSTSNNSTSGTGSNSGTSSSSASASGTQSTSASGASAIQASSALTMGGLMAAAMAFLL